MLTNWVNTLFIDIIQPEKCQVLFLIFNVSFRETQGSNSIHRNNSKNVKFLNLYLIIMSKFLLEICRKNTNVSILILSLYIIVFQI